METKENLQKQLDSLITKWRGNVPKSDMDKRWWKFKTDRTLALRLRDQLAYYETYCRREEEIKLAEIANKEEMKTYEEIFK